MKVEKQDIDTYKMYAEKLGLPVSLFVKMVLKLYAKKVYDDLIKKSNIT
ncbi:MAG: hypothetical protein IH595_14840 [Bacteroidales bacterium]|nr:hypothetical protein [Bacteroidales bacterium]